MINKKNITRAEVWEAIWYADNTTMTKTSDFLKSLISPLGQKSSRGVKKLAFIVGHNARRSGAYAPHPVAASEYDLNGEIGDEMIELANGSELVQVKIFRRKKMSGYGLEIDEVYSRVNDWGADLAVEGHFNWLNGAGRVEMLHYPGSGESERFAGLMLSKVKSLLGIDKGKLESRGKNDRGGRSLWACRCPIVLAEPFDCSNKDHLLVIERLGAKGIARSYFDAVTSFFE